MVASPPVREEEAFSFWVALCFTLNSIMGTGFLTLPWAFARSGVLLATVGLAVTAFLGNISKDLILEVMARAEYLRTHKESLAEEGTLLTTIRRAAGPPPATTTSPQPPQITLIRQVSGSGTVASEDEDVATVGPRPMEYSQLCEAMLGRWARQSYALVLSIFCYGALWAYASVFASALAEDLPLYSQDSTTEVVTASAPPRSYHVYLLLFAAINLPLTCMELKDQVTVQVFLSACRLTVVALMVATTAAAYHSTTPVFGTQTGAAGTAMADPGQLYLFLPLALYAMMFHHFIPSLAHPVRNKPSLSKLFSAAFVVCTCFYVLLGATVAWYFGPGTRASSNLLWRHYEGQPGMPSWLVKAIRHYVVLFPALDVCTAFPLTGITLGNNLMGAYYGARPPALHEDKTRWIRIGFRLLAGVPALMGATFVRDLGIITSYTGAVGFSICFIFPAILHQASRDKAIRTIGRQLRTVYSSYWTEQLWVSKAMLVLGTGFTIYALVLNIIGGEASR